jgi:branched-chain amino acid transport system ATP-binding protein
MSTSSRQPAASDDDAASARRRQRRDARLSRNNSVRPQARELSAGYGPQAVIYDVDITVRPGEVVALLGSNGAGKTTTLLTLAGELPPLAGDVLFDGVVVHSPLYRRARNGLTFVTEEKSVFMGLSTRDNLRVAQVDVDEALALFPNCRSASVCAAGCCRAASSRC